MAGYSIAEMVKPKKDYANVEAFFTTKGKELFCIIPSYRPQIKLRNFKVAAGASVSILGSNKLLKIKQVGQNAIVDLSALKPGDVEAELFVLQIKNAL
jgi:alpha-L-fucosidase